MAHAGHTMGPVGRVSTDAFDPAVYLRSFNGSGLADAERDRFYRQTPRPDGSLLREYRIVAVDREIEITAPARGARATYHCTPHEETMRGAIIVE